MQRIKTKPRNNWQKEVEKLGFGFHTTDIPYWDESAYYSFTMPEVLEIEKATNVLWDVCLGAVQHVMDNNLYSSFAIPEWFIPQIEKSWEHDAPAIYGRFDFCFKNGIPKMFEFNADTPTSLFEAGIVQWFWLQDFDKSKDQFNSVHEKLIGYWKYLKEYLHPGMLHFTCLKQTLEDLTTTEYMRDCAMQASIETKLVFIDDIGWDGSQFVDLEGAPMKNIFKLYPYEFLVKEEFGKNIVTDANRALWIEPAWKMLLSNKAILPVLWELYPDCPYILPAYYETGRLTDYVKKPILGREGANLSIIKDGRQIETTSGEYGREGYVYQQEYSLPSFDGNYTVVGSWVIGQEAAGMGIRESASLITSNTSRFVPHLIV